MTRRSNELRPIRIKRKFTNTTPGSVMINSGNTMVLCTASVDTNLPPWLTKNEPPGGWITAEYNMLPGSTRPRKTRDRLKIDGRTTEIQRLIGRSLRAVADLQALGPVQITVDCDVIQADGGTRTASITGAFIALVDAIHSIRKQLPDSNRYPLRDSLAAISVGIVNNKPHLDLDYEMDAGAQVDMNIVMTGRGEFIEIQGTGEETTFSDKDLSSLLTLARSGISQLTELQKTALGKSWPF